MKKYFVVDTASGQKYGPADVPTLNAWIAEGRMNAQSTLEDADTGERIVAHMVQGLSVGPAAPSTGAYGEMPVSYTHLDVYKRQGLSFPLRLPAGVGDGPRQCCL